ncbi:MAG: lactonase family protein [Acidobacteria bacterium]|nr:lactonase family protein [Acidobacteriota bacterium]
MNRRQALLTLAGAAVPAWARAKEYIVYVGTYTNGNKSKGIHAFRMNVKTGELSPVGLVGEVTNPSFLTIHPNGRTLYAVSEIANYQGQRSGAVTGFQIDRNTGMLTKLNTSATKGDGACHLVVDKTGKNVVVANYGGGSVASIPIKDDAGNLGDASAFIQHKGSSVDNRRQMNPHAHSVNISADNRFVMVADLGLDQVLVYQLDPAQGSLTPHNPPFAKVTPGGGPRHFTFHPKGKFAYTNQEMKSAVTAFRWNAASGVLDEIQVISTLPQDYTGTGNSTAEILCHPSGKYVYCSNRGHDSIAVFKVHKDGKLTRIGNVSTQGRTPRNFNIDPSGRWLIAANQATDSIVLFRIGKDGNLTPAGQKLDVGAPVCVKFLQVA